MIRVSPKSIPLDAVLYIIATDTCYGFSARFNDTEAITLIQKLKGREELKPFSLLFSFLAEAEKYVQISDEQKIFIGSQQEPSSFVLKKSKKLKNYFPGMDTVSIRMCNPHFPVHLPSILGVPVTTTSVNISGEKELYSPEDIEKKFSHASDSVVLIDSGVLPPIKPSTIWDMTQFPYKKLR